MRRDALVVEDGDIARALADWTLREGYRGWDVDTEGVLAEDPASVADDLAALSSVGVDKVVIRPICDDHAVETLRCCGRAVDRLVD